jgi:hypothetical protein
MKYDELWDRLSDLSPPKDPVPPHFAVPPPHSLQSYSPSHACSDTQTWFMFFCTLQRPLLKRHDALQPTFLPEAKSTRKEKQTTAAPMTVFAVALPLEDGHKLPMCMPQPLVPYLENLEWIRCRNELTEALDQVDHEEHRRSQRNLLYGRMVASAVFVGAWICLATMGRWSKTDNASKRLSGIAWTVWFVSLVVVRILMHIRDARNASYKNKCGEKVQAVAKRHTREFQGRPGNLVLVWRGGGRNEGFIEVLVDDAATNSSTVTGDATVDGDYRLIEENAVV